MPTKMYLIEDDVHYAVSHHQRFDVIAVPDRGDVLFYSPVCSSFYFPEHASLETIQQAAVAAAVYRLFACWQQRLATLAIAPIIRNIPDDVIDAAFAISSCGMPTRYNDDITATNPRRLGYLIDGPVDLETFTSIVYDAFPTRYMAALWTSVRLNGRDLGECFDIVSEYDRISTPLGLVLWTEENNTTEDDVHPTRRKKLIDGVLI